MTQLRITRPDDWHLHLRDGDALEHTVAASARYFGRAIIMPNLTPPVTTTDQAASYRDRILAARPQGSLFEPLMTLYLTDNTSTAELERAKQSGFVHAVKLYPSGATTNSDAGVTDVSKLAPIFKCLEELDLPLLVHGEVTDSDIDIFDREKTFIDRYLRDIVEQQPNLRVVLEHITTADAVEFVTEARDGVAATITAHHLLYNRNHMLVGGIRPHYYCLPILKRNSHQDALIQAATSGNPKFFLGTDSAPHATDKKESACGCAGCFTAHAAIELYAQAFSDANALDKLEDFASHFGPDFYGLPRNTDSITLQQTPWQVPESLPLGKQQITPLEAGNTLNWQVVSQG